jgi:DNA polymerase-3 subunit delta'
MPFRDVIGHRRIVALLARSVARGSLPPSLVFAGPAGVGKRLTATALAQALNCLNRSTSPPPSLEPSHSSFGEASQTPDTEHPAPGPKHQATEVDSCGTCASCTRIARAIHADVLLLEPGDTGAIKIEQVREAVDRAAYRPFEGRRRVVVIDEADALVPAAQNALLKTLEEPPSLSVFILVTARPDVLLSTVRSRCHRLDFRPLSPNEIALALVARGQTETEARAVAATADGSLGRALEATASDFVQARDVAGQVLTHAASTPDPRRRIEGTKDLLAKTGSGGASDRAQLSVHLRARGSLLRDIELLGARADAGRLANPDVRPTLDRLTPTYRGARGLRAFAAVERALAALERNAGVKTVADWLVLEL